MPKVNFLHYKSKCPPQSDHSDVINDVISGHSRPDPDVISWRYLMQWSLPTGTVTSLAGGAKGGGLPFVLLDIHSCRIGFESFWEGGGPKNFRGGAKLPKFGPQWV